MASTRRPRSDHASADANSAAAYMAALQPVLSPLVRLLLSRAVSYPNFEELLQRTFVLAARTWFMSDSERATASRLSMLTGIHRKKIAALLEQETPVRAKPGIAQLTRDAWTADPAFLDSKGCARALSVTRRAGGPLSFEALVESVSRDIRSRAVLDQMLNDGHVRIDEAGKVHLQNITRKVRLALEDEVHALERLLSAATEAVVNAVLKTSARSAANYVQVGGLSEAAARELTIEMRVELSELLQRMNARAEQRAREDQRAGNGGDCILRLGSFQWIEGQSSAPRTAEPAPVAESGKARRPRAASNPSPAKPKPLASLKPKKQKPRVPK